jgi:hypothetical protein
LERIDSRLFEIHFDAFVRFVEKKSDEVFLGFPSNSYTEPEEEYKARVHAEGRRRLGCSNWTDQDAGSGAILESVISAIEIEDNNMVQWDLRRGEAGREHKKLHELKGLPAERMKVETVFKSMYGGGDAADCFEQLTVLIGRRYRLIAYLFFLRDMNRYMPIVIGAFEEAFGLLGVPFHARRQCTWENYQEYLAVLSELRELLRSFLSDDVRLLDAHSFAWMLVHQMKTHESLPDPSVDVDLIEGGRDVRTSTYFERSAVARRKCIELHGISCKACGVSLAETYGEIGAGFIHVHHVLPLSERDGGYQVNPERDLVPVCPNCHAMLHRQSPALTIEELQALVDGPQG